MHKMAAAQEFTIDDFKELSNIYAGEFNRSEMHDRILVLDIFHDNLADEISPVSCVLNQEKRRSHVEDACVSGICTRAMSKVAGEGAPASLNASTDSVEKPVLKRRTSAVMSLRNRKVLKSINESAGNCKIKDEFPTGKDQTIKQHKIFTHSSWLSVHSSYFRALFYSGLKESHLKEVHMKVPKSEEVAHLHLIEAMYRLDVLNDLSADELLVILVLADKYDAKFVFKKCRYVLQTKINSVKLCEDIFNAVKVKHCIRDVDHIIEAIQSFLIKEFSPLDGKWESPSFENLSEELLRLLLGSNNLLISCEDVVFHALMHWIKNNPKFAVNSQNISVLLSTSNLLSVIRYDLLSACYLISVIQHHPIAKQMENFDEFYLKSVNYAALPYEVAFDVSKADAIGTRKVKENIIQFRWKMPEKEVLKALLTVQSQPFWACGYQMQLSLHRKSGINNNFCVSVTLGILSLKEGGFTCLIWDLQYNGKTIFSGDDFYDECTFYANGQGSEKVGSFKWVGQESCMLDLTVYPVIR